MVPADRAARLQRRLRRRKKARTGSDPALRRHVAPFIIYCKYSYYENKWSIYAYSGKLLTSFAAQDGFLTIGSRHRNGLSTVWVVNEGLQAKTQTRRRRINMPHCTARRQTAAIVLPLSML